MSAPTPITIARGDGIGPEIMDAVLVVLTEAGARLELDEVVVGEAVYRAGNLSGIDPALWSSIRQTRVFLKAPLTTPQGGGFKSVNVTTRKTLGLFANVRPSRALAPFVATRHPKMDLVVIRENEEDLYAGIEHQQTDEVVQCLKLISRPGTERLVRYAFEYARANGRRRVTCFTKDNIMKLTDGLFRRVFEEVAAEYPDLEHEHGIIDIGMARVADTPERFDVVVVPNLYGDILSDVTAQIAGSVGLGGSANVGEHAAMFEAIHGSAPDIAGRDIANPSGLLQAAVMMLVHIGQGDVAERIQNAWLRTLEDGVHTRDIAQEGTTKQVVGTRAFAGAVIERLGQAPEQLERVAYQRGASLPVAAPAPRPRAAKERRGVDVFVAWDAAARDPEILASELRRAEADNGLRLVMITNRGQKVWPNGAPETFCTDHWRCRFERASGAVQAREVFELLGRIDEVGHDVIKTEHLFTFDGVQGYSRGQGQ